VLSGAMKKLLKARPILLVTAVAVIGGTHFLREIRERQGYRSKIVALTSELRNKQSSSDELRRFLREPRFSGLILYDNSASSWAIETPLEFGARNWILYVELSNSKVVEFRVRTIDSMNDHPKEAPPDWINPRDP
jgi:hypothetical protein